MATNNDDDARRDLEQKALRNVRGLVDKIEADDRKGSQKQLVAVVIVVTIVAVAGGAYLVSRGKSTEGQTAIEITPPTKPVAK
jgi:flagellar basal body-associated protein FliL